jgi:7,8-dihydroneopterin aldolase/epimerase/oxygenase
VSTRQAITLHGMQFHTLIGVLPHEAEVPQPVEIDLTVWRGGADGGFAVDYRGLYQIVVDAVGPGHGPYLEDVADRLAARALAVPGVSSVRVAVRKPHVALPGPLAYAEVVLERDAGA